MRLACECINAVRRRNVIMRSFRIVMGEIFPALFRNDRRFVVGSRNGADCIDRVLEDDRDELDFRSGISA
jgi:hypothetical protein